MNLPSPFLSAIRSLLGEEECRRLTGALSVEPCVSIRLNPHKAPGPAASGEQVPWCGSGYYLPVRPAFTFDPLFHTGCYYVQEASSMFVEQALKQCLPVGRPVVMLDLCAAPGGKSTHALSLLPEGSLLVANEVIRSRAQVLAENLTKWGCPNTIVTQNDPADFASLTGVFDVLLTDVPCSGEGMFRKDPAAIEEWSIENVEHCRWRQRRILKDVWPSLKPGGLLIYSTCTYNTLENEENVAWICQELGAEPIRLEVQEAWNITSSLTDTSLPVCRFFPHKTKGEGFFLAALRKTKNEEEPNVSAPAFSRKTDKKQRTAFSKEALQTARGWVKEADKYAWNVCGNTLSAFPLAHQALLERCKQILRILQAGIEVAEAKGKDLLPMQALALSTALQAEAFPLAEADYGQTIAYLRKEAIRLPPSVPRGFALLTCRNVPLGFVKNVGNRANNLYPAGWRIRSGHVPEKEETVISCQ